MRIVEADPALKWEWGAPNNDEGEVVYIRECLCGEKFLNDLGRGRGSGRLFLDSPGKVSVCPKCGRKFFLQITHTIYEVVEES